MTVRPKSRQNRGYTVVELMMALAIFSVGVTGITAMQSVTASTNRFAKNMSVATSLARSWQDNLGMDASRWGGPSGWVLGNTRWLGVVDTSDAWTLPANNADTNFGPGADAKGGFVVPGSENLVFCTHIRITRLIDESLRPGSGLLRSEVRVFWPKDIQAWSGGDPYCVDDADVGSIGADTNSFHFVYQSSVVRQTPAF